MPARTTIADRAPRIPPTMRLREPGLPHPEQIGESVGGPEDPNRRLPRRRHLQGGFNELHPDRRRNFRDRNRDHHPLVRRGPAYSNAGEHANGRQVPDCASREHVAYQRWRGSRAPLIRPSPILFGLSASLLISPHTPISRTLLAVRFGTFARRSIDRSTARNG